MITTIFLREIRNFRNPHTSSQIPNLSQTLFSMQGIFVLNVDSGAAADDNNDIKLF